MDSSDTENALRTMKNLPLIKAHNQMSMIQLAIAQLAKDTSGECKTQEVVPRLDAVSVAISDMLHGLQKYRAEILGDAVEFEQAPGQPVEAEPIIHRITDEDFNEELPKKACALDDPECEACQ